MFEARLKDGKILKQIVDSMKELVDTANFECSDESISIQAMDSSHVSLVSLYLKSDGFDHFRCDKGRFLGIKMAVMAKLLKCADNSDIISLKASDDEDNLSLQFEDECQTKISEFKMKLMEIEAEPMQIPETEYAAQIEMPAAEFMKICRDMQTIGDTCKIAVSKDGVKFEVKGVFFHLYFFGTV